MDVSSSQGFPSSPGPGRAQAGGAGARNLGGLPSSSADQDMATPSDSDASVARGGAGAGQAARGGGAAQQNVAGGNARAAGNGRDRERPDEAAEEGAGGPRGPRPRNHRDIANIPPVTDQTGEKVRESFEHFLEK